MLRARLHHLVRRSNFPKTRQARSPLQTLPLVDGVPPTAMFARDLLPSGRDCIGRLARLELVHSFLASCHFMLLFFFRSRPMIATMDQRDILTLSLAVVLKENRHMLNHIKELGDCSRAAKVIVEGIVAKNFRIEREVSQAQWHSTP